MKHTLVVLTFKRVIHTLLVFIFMVVLGHAQDIELEKIQRDDKVVIFAKNNSSKLQLVTLNLLLENVIPDKTLPIEIIVKPGERKELLTLSPVPLKAWSYKTRYSFEEYQKSVHADIANTGKPQIPNNQAAVESSNKDSDSGPTASNEGRTVNVSDNHRAPEKSSKSSNTAVKFNSQTQSMDVSSSSATRHMYMDSAQDYFVLPPENSDDEAMPSYYARSFVKESIQKNTGNERMSQSRIFLFEQAGCPRCAMARDYFIERDIAYKPMSITGNDDNQQLMNKYLFDSGFQGGKFMMPVVVVDGKVHYSIENLDKFLADLATN